MQDALDSAAASAIDPVCGMAVDPRTAVSLQHGGASYYFCCEGCRASFAANPSQYLGAAGAPGGPGDAAQHAPADEPSAPGVTDGARAEPGPEAAIWTCPMHPEIRRDAPGSCPICGMALEPLEPTAEEG